MYNDYATLNLDQFEKVATEYNKVLSVNALNVNDTNYQFEQLVDECASNIKKLYNTSNNLQNRQIISNLLAKVEKLSQNVKINSVNQKNYFVKSFEFCGNVKQCLTSVCKAICVCNDSGKKQTLFGMFEDLLSLIGNCKYLK